MTRKTIKQVSWTGGQLSTQAMALQDSAIGQELFLRSSTKIENAVVLPITGIKRRGGFGFVNSVNKTMDDGRLEFIEIENIRYMILLSELFIEIYDLTNNSQPQEIRFRGFNTDFKGKLTDINIGRTQRSLLLVHGDFHPQRLYLNSSGNWGLEDIKFKKLTRLTKGVPTLEDYDFFNDPNVGYPQFISSITNRLILASTKKLPNVIWFSMTDINNKEDNLFTFVHDYVDPATRQQSRYNNTSQVPAGSAGDIYPIEKYISLRNVKILGLLATDNLFIFTDVGIITTTNVFTPNGLDFNLQTPKQLFSRIKPFFANNKIFFYSDNTLNSYQYTREIARYKITQVSSMFAGLTNPERLTIFNKIDNENPDMVLYLDKDKKLTVTYMIKQLTSQEIIDGVAIGEWTSQLKFIDVKSDEVGNLYLLCKDKNNKAMIVKYDDNCLLDGSSKFSNTKFDSSFYFQQKLDHFEGENVGIVADNMWFEEDHTVTKGKINSFSPTIKQDVEVGYSFYMNIEKTLFYSTFTKTASLAQTNFMLLNTGSLSVEYKNKKQQIIAKPIPIPLDRSQPFRVQRKSAKFQGSMGKENDDDVLSNATFMVFQNAPLYANIMSIEYEYEV